MSWTRSFNCQNNSLYDKIFAPSQPRFIQKRPSRLKFLSPAVVCPDLSIPLRWWSISAFTTLLPCTLEATAVGNSVGIESFVSSWGPLETTEYESSDLSALIQRDWAEDVSARYLFSNSLFSTIDVPSFPLFWGEGGSPLFLTLRVAKLLDLDLLEVDRDGRQNS